MSLSIFLAGVVSGLFLAGGHGHRTARKEADILSHLAEHGPCTGLEMVAAGLGKRGTIYVRLHRMEERGLLRQDGRRDSGTFLYAITEVGHAALLVEVARNQPREATL